MQGKGTLVSAKSEQAIEWGLRNDKSGQRFFVLWFDPEKPAKGEVTFTAHFRNTHAQAKAALGAVSLSPQGEAVLSAGLITVSTSAGYDLAITKANGVTRVTKGLGHAPAKLPRSYSFQFNDTTPEVAFTATESDPDANRIFFDEFDLKGRPGRRRGVVHPEWNSGGAPCQGREAAGRVWRSGAGVDPGDKRLQGRFLRRDLHAGVRQGRHVSGGPRVSRAHLGEGRLEQHRFWRRAGGIEAGEVERLAQGDFV